MIKLFNFRNGNVKKEKDFISSFISRYFSLFFIGFANAVAVPLMGSILSIWLMESGFAKNSIGFFALLGIPFSFKILWAPIIDHITLPFFSGRQRKGWMFLALVGISLSLLNMSLIDPAVSPWRLAASLFSLSLFTGCLYIVGIAYELESIQEEKYGMGSACVITGYRFGLLCGGAGALYLSFLWDWSWAYRSLAMIVGIGGLFILSQPEPYKSKAVILEKRQRFSAYPTLIQGFWNETILQPCHAFLQKSNWQVILLLLCTFKLGDQMARSMEGPFYLSLGFDKASLASAAKVWGIIATISGAFLAGFFLKGRDPFFSLGWVGMIHALSLSCYCVMSIVGKSLLGLYLTVAVENFTGGMAMTAFIFFLWKICDKRYAAVQYALLWSLFSFKADLFACLGGILANSLPWTSFFFIVTLLNVLSSCLAWILILRAKKMLPV